VPHRAGLRVGAEGAVVITDVGSDRVAPHGSGVKHLIKVRVADVETSS
jgi:hypothetical protein